MIKNSTPLVILRTTQGDKDPFKLFSPQDVSGVCAGAHIRDSVGWLANRPAGLPTVAHQPISKLFHFVSHSRHLSSPHSRSQRIIANGFLALETSGLYHYNIDHIDYTGLHRSLQPLNSTVNMRTCFLNCPVFVVSSSRRGQLLVKVKNRTKSASQKSYQIDKQVKEVC